MGRRAQWGRNATRAKRGPVPAVVVGCIALVCAPWVTTAMSAAAAGSGVTPIGPVLTADETATISIARDGGMSVPLPNGKAFWLFGDTPIFRLESGAWFLRGFVLGSTAGEGAYAKGQAPAGLLEVNVGRDLSPANRPTSLIPPADNINLPDGSGRACTPANGAVESGRWPSGAVLMPDQVNVLVTYMAVCDPTPGDYHVVGWGFLEFNWLTNTISSGPHDVFAPAADGSSIPNASVFMSPIVAGNQLVLFSKTRTNVYQTTIAPDLATLTDPGSYHPQVIPGLPAPHWFSVSVDSSPQQRLRLLEQTDVNGGFAVSSAPSPAGPWVEDASGTLPGCGGWTSGLPCAEYYSHPELSTASKLLVSYYQPGYGPGVPSVPDSTLFHLTVVAISLTTSPTTLTVTSSALPGATVGHKFRTKLAASGGTADTWSIANGALPPGLALNATTGVIAGTPSKAGIYGFTAVARQSAAPPQTDSATLWIITESSTGGLPPSAPSTVRAASRAAATSTGALLVRYVAGSNNGSAIAKYTATCTSANGGATRTGVQSGATPAPITVAGATTAKKYSCRVTATNAAGTSPSSAASAPVTVGAPTAPTKVRATRVTAGKLKVTFAPGAHNGAPIGSYAVTCKSANGGVAKSATGAVGPIVITGVTVGRAYTCTVKARNSRGAGPASLPSPSVLA